MGEIFVWITIGISTGLLLYSIDVPKERGGLLGVLFLEILGACEGGYFAEFLLGIGQTMTLLLNVVIMAISGALLLYMLRKGIYQVDTFIRRKTTASPLAI